jgi:hypothetical protein
MICLEIAAMLELFNYLRQDLAGNESVQARSMDDWPKSVNCSSCLPRFHSKQLGEIANR